MPPRTINGVAIDWDAVKAPAPPIDPPRCPLCGCKDKTMVELAGREGYCNCCGRAFTLPKG